MYYRSSYDDVSSSQKWPSLMGAGVRSWKEREASKSSALDLLSKHRETLQLPSLPAHHTLTSSYQPPITIPYTAMTTPTDNPLTTPTLNPQTTPSHNPLTMPTHSHWFSLRQSYKSRQSHEGMATSSSDTTNASHNNVDSSRSHPPGREGRREGRGGAFSGRHHQGGGGGMFSGRHQGGDGVRVGLAPAGVVAAATHKLRPIRANTYVQGQALSTKQSLL